MNKHNEHSHLVNLSPHTHLEKMKTKAELASPKALMIQEEMHYSFADLMAQHVPPVLVEALVGVGKPEGVGVPNVLGRSHPSSHRACCGFHSQIVD